MKRAAILLLILAAACGKEGVPRPPVPVIPRQTTDLSAVQRGARVVLSWSYPAFTTTDQSLPDLQRIIVYRYRELGPVTLEPAPPAEIDGDAVERTVFETIPKLQPGQFVRLAEELAKIEKEKLPGFARGARVLFTDQPALRGEAGEPLRYSYGVVTVGLRGRGAMSNLVSVVPVDAPLPPPMTTAEALEPGIQLRWQVPTGTVLGGGLVGLLGYNVYRLPAEGRVVEPSRPINSEVIEETWYLDQPSYGVHRYAVTAVLSDGEVPVESDFPLMISAEYRDMTPPPPPGRIHALAEETSVRLVWDAVQAPDFAGYRLYRTVAGGRTELLTPGLITETFFVDESPELGIEYVYSVTALDERRNESEQTKTAPVLLAR